MKALSWCLLVAILAVLAVNVVVAADSVATHVIKDAKYQYVVHLTNVSDGTGETNVVKVDKSTLTAADGAEPAAIDIEQVEWNIQGFSYVQMLWDHGTADLTALVLNGSGYKDFRNNDGGILGFAGGFALNDPRTNGGTGDLMLFTGDADSGDSYDITVWIRKQPD